MISNTDERPVQLSEEDMIALAKLMHFDCQPPPMTPSESDTIVCEASAEVKRLLTILQYRSREKKDLVRPTIFMDSLAMIARSLKNASDLAEFIVHLSDDENRMRSFAQDCDNMLRYERRLKELTDSMQKLHTLAARAIERQVKEHLKKVAPGVTVAVDAKWKIVLPPAGDLSTRAALSTYYIK